MTQEARRPSAKFSCVTCAHRKIRCDRREPECGQCQKNHISCVYQAPPPPRRRKKGIREVDVATRLRIYEEALKKIGVDPEALVKNGALNTESSGLQRNGTAQRDFTHQDNEAGVLVADFGKSRYLENGIWTSLQSEFRESKEILEDESTDEETSPEGPSPQSVPTLNNESLIFGRHSLSIKLVDLHPAPWHIFKIWQLYLSNINSLVKLFHAPTVQEIISDASGHLDDLPRNVEALLFGIYCMTIGSLGDSDCIALLGLPKKEAVQRYRSAAQSALTNANLLKTSDIMVLQAFTLFIVST